MCFIAKKQSRKEDQEKKRLEALARKKERDDLAKQEEKETASKPKISNVKLTQARIREENEKRALAAKKASAKPEPETHLTIPLEENINR